MKKYKLNDKFSFNNETMIKMRIPIIDEMDGHKEIWSFIKLDRHKQFNKQRKYIISSYGRVYNLEKMIMCNSVDSGISTTKGNYRQVSLRFDGKNYTYFIHRLIALAFIPKIKNKPYVNHKDGIPFHNYLWNLEWCDVSENMIHAIKNGLKIEKRGENRSNSKWTDDEIRFICKLMEDGHKATYIYRTLKIKLNNDPRVEYERIRSLYKHIIHKTHWTHISQNYNINFSRNNYSKEKGSVQKRLNELT